MKKRKGKEVGKKEGLVGKTTSLSQPKPKKLPEGPSTMERIKTGGNKVSSLAERVKARSKAKGYPKGW